MPQFIKVAEISQIPKGKLKEFNVSGKTIAIANTEGQFLAFDGICTHAHCALAGGFIDGLTLTCYCHGAQFDVKTGKVLSPPAEQPINVYPVQIKDGDILVKI